MPYLIYGIQSTDILARVDPMHNSHINVAVAHITVAVAEPALFLFCLIP